MYSSVLFLYFQSFENMALKTTLEQIEDIQEAIKT